MDARAIRAAAGLLVGLVHGGLAGCGDGGHEPIAPPDAHAWDVVVVVLDTLPAEAVGCYGRERDVTPRIDAFAAEAVRFDNAFASASYTLASTASLFTGLGPGAHRVVGLKSNLLDDGHVTLAERLARAGFDTAGFSGNAHVTREGGFGQGFAHFRYYDFDAGELHAVPGGFVDDVLAWWSEERDARRFLYVHLLPPHQPYDPPAPHDALFGAADVPREEGSTDFLIELDRSHTVTESDPVVARIRDRYDAGLHYADAVFGELVDRLDAAGARENAVVVLLSDHGEGFAQHGRLLHGTTPFQEMTQVPLIVRWPGAEPGVREGLVRTRDLAATLCELTDVPWLAGEAGESFLAEVLDARRTQERTVVSRTVGGTPMWSLRTNRWSLVEHRYSDTLLLFDRAADPEERIDVSERHPDVAAELSAELSRRIEEDRATASRLNVQGGSVTAFESQLENLGYTDDE